MNRKNYVTSLCICLIISILLSCGDTVLAAGKSQSIDNTIPVEENPAIQNRTYAKGILPIQTNAAPDNRLSMQGILPIENNSVGPEDIAPLLPENTSSAKETPAAQQTSSPETTPNVTEKPAVTPTPPISETSVPNTSLPASYDLRNDAVITDIKDQGSSGACWAFSALKSAESNAILKGLLSIDKADFSESHLTWFSFHASTTASDPLYQDGFYPISNEPEAAYYRGGSALLASFTMARWSGIVPEKSAPFQAATRRQTQSMAASMKKATKKLRYQSSYHMQNATCYDNAGRNVIKNALLTKGALSVGLYYARDYLHTNSSGVTTYYQNLYKAASAISAANHCVTIIGWDDQFSRNNFPAAHRPAKDGAWLIANSYGTSVGDQGYFWLSYYEPSICEIYSFEVESNKNYDTNYQYDGSGWGSAIVGNQNAVKAANIYTTVQDYHQSLRAVGLYTINDNQAYKIQIYTNPKNNKPASGTLVSASTTSGTIPYNGFHTIPLKRPVTLKAGTRFSVVVTYSNCPAGKNYMPIEGAGQTSSANAIQTIYGSKTGQSFYYSTATKKWIDIAKNGYNNLCVKAFAKNTKKAPSIQLSEKKVVLGKGETYLP
ncbi:MAG: hypothetical protein K2J67_04955, partial [Lachnospiraceae bacterium]|nr:hypothetical protein [Lachnospiraceae bacterium]